VRAHARVLTGVAWSFLVIGMACALTGALLMKRKYPLGDCPALCGND